MPPSNHRLKKTCEESKPTWLTSSGEEESEHVFNMLEETDSQKDSLTYTVKEKAD